MKKLLIAALIYVPMTIAAQTTKPTGQPAGQPGGKMEVQQGKDLRYTPESLYADVIVVTTNTNGNVITSIRLDFGQNITDILTDKELITQITAWRATNFTTVPDALNYMAAMGFRILTTYSTNGALGTDTHILLEKKVGKRGPEPSATPQRPPSAPADPAQRPATPPTRPTPTDGKKGGKG